MAEDYEDGNIQRDFSRQTPSPQPGAVSTQGVPTMSTHIGGYHVDQLIGHRNFSTWKFYVKNDLIIDGLWKCVLGEDADPARDVRALARICLAVSSSCYQYVLKAKTSKEAWNNLAKVFEDSGHARKVMLHRKLHRVEISAFNSMSEYIEHVMMLVQQLADFNEVIDDGEVSEILLGLSQENVSNLQTDCMTSILTSKVVRSRLLQEQSRRAASCIKTTFMSKPASTSSTTKEWMTHGNVEQVFQVKA